MALIVGLASPVLIGTTGFAVDASFWVAQHTALQTAVDAGAYKAARDLASNPGASGGVLAADALAAANAAIGGQFALTAAEITVAQQADARQVKVSASIPGDQFFSQVYYKSPITISASSVAGVAYNLVSTQATCFAADSYTFLYSTGFGTIDTAHSSGLDPFQCGTPPTPPPAYGAFCGGGVLGCNLDLLGAGSYLVPFAIQAGPGGGAGGLNLTLAPVLNTLSGLLGASFYSGSGSMTSYGSGSCAGQSCTIPAGVYNGGLSIGPGVTATFAAGNYIIENGNLVISTQAIVTANNATFYFGGTNPGGLVETTQVAVNTAPLNNGSITLTSASTFTSSSVVGSQTSAPVAAMPYAQSQQTGLLAVLDSPGGNLLGTNFESEVATCPQATSICANPATTMPVYQNDIIPGLGTLSQTLAGIGITLLPVDVLTSEGERSTTTITSGVTYANGVPTNWAQSEAATSTLTSLGSQVQPALNALGVGGVLNTLLVSPLLNAVLAAIDPSQGPATQTTGASGVFPGQAAGAAPGCAGQALLYSQSIIPNFGSSFSDILNTSGSAGGNGGVNTQDSIAVCGQAAIANITPVTPGTTLVSSTATGASSIYLLQ